MSRRRAPERPVLVDVEGEPVRRRLRPCPRCEQVPADGLFVAVAADLVCTVCAGVEG